MNTKEDNIYRAMQSLNAFSSVEVMILKEDQNFLANQNYLNKELDELRKGKADFVSHEELENSLNEVIAKYDDNTTP